MTHPYARERYVAVLAREGERATTVASWRTAALVRPVAEGGIDGVGAYPMAVLHSDSDLEAGFDELAQAGLISFVMVADPVRGPSAEPLAAAFDVARPFKTHYLVEPARYAPTKHHRAEIRRGLRRCEIEVTPFADVIEAWAGLYEQLTARHNISGVAAFSNDYWRYLAGTGEVEAFAARADGRIVSLSLWLSYDGVAYNHLGASSPEGYAAGAGYVLYDAAIRHYSGVAVLNLGGGAGLLDDPSDGLASFKRGFSTGAVSAHLYGKVLNRNRYAELAQSRSTSFFPAYRS